MKSIRHILVVTPAFPEDHEQGIVVPCVQLYLKELKIRHPLIKISVISIHFPFTSVSYQWQDISVYPLNAANGKRFWRPFVWAKGFLIGKSLHHTLPVDLVHSFWYNEATFLAQRIALQYSIPHLATFMGQDAKKSNFYRFVIRPKSLMCACLSSFHFNTIRDQLGITPTGIAPFGISSYDDEISTPCNKDRSIDLICVSSLIALKRIKLFIELVDRLKEKNPYIKAQILGKGPLAKNLHQEIMARGLQSNVLLVGEMNRRHCLSTLASARILIHTSEYESQGYVLNEALALGCHVITMSAGLKVDNTSFTIVPDTNALFDKANELLSLGHLSHNPIIPIRMEDTIIDYETMLNAKGLSFN